MTDQRRDILGTIGRTPLVELETLSRETGCQVFAKLEFLNLLGGIKDRRVHCHGTGLEIWEQMGGRIKAFVAGSAARPSGASGRWQQGWARQARIMTVLSEGVSRYFSTIFPDEWMQSQGFLLPNCDQVGVA